MWGCLGLLFPQFTSISSPHEHSCPTGKCLKAESRLCPGSSAPSGTRAHHFESTDAPVAIKGSFCQVGISVVAWRSEAGFWETGQGGSESVSVLHMLSHHRAVKYKHRALPI